MRLQGDGTDLGTPKQRVVLAMLVGHVGRLVSVDELVDELWPEAPPRSAVANVRSYAANLRRTFDRRAGGRGLLVREGACYRLTAPPDRTDAVRTRALPTA
ncbi:AfsR/SARP family transcriptional regulator [Micromonospora citrea]|uniref:AfsR/SARP family transcriptional regulator n=1 Tax=Micromonospora citrea TaxID=47855 RepID=UPI003C4D40E4